MYGTAGPIDLGFEFSFFRSPMRYAWIGTDGAIGLSSDTNNIINLVRGFSGEWTIPGEQSVPYGVPRNFVSALLYFFTLEKTPGNNDPHVSYLRDGKRFIVEWNRMVGFYFAAAGEFTGQLVLDAIDSSITVLYKNINPPNFYTAFGLVGLEADTSRWFFLNQNGFPSSDRKSTRLNSSHIQKSRMPSSA